MVLQEACQKRKTETENEQKIWPEMRVLIIDVWQLPEMPNA